MEAKRESMRRKRRRLLLLAVEKLDHRQAELARRQEWVNAERRELEAQWAALTESDTWPDDEIWAVDAAAQPEAAT